MRLNVCAMKNYFLLLTFLLTINQATAQKAEVCAFDTPDSGRSFCSTGFTASASIDPNYLESFPPVVFNLHFWGVNKNDGTSERPLLLDDVLEVVANLNIEFNPFDIYFKYSGHDYINNSTYYIIDGDEPLFLENYAAANGYKNVNALNFYVPYDIVGSSGTANSCNGTLRVRSLRFKNWHSLHEMGHVFELKHTFFEDCEKVTRNPSDPDYNADTRGDKVVDTAAAVEWIDDVNVDPIECRYLNTDLECGGLIPLEIFEQDILNYMQYELNDCRYPPGGVFTIGQAIRMREAILADPNDTYLNASTTIASLYEPYDGVYKPCCWGFSERPPVFQPGFDYEFVYCQDIIPLSPGRTEPWPWGDLSFTTGDVVYSFDKFYSDYDEIEHLNHLAIRILQIEDQPRRCYSNYSISSMSPPVTNEEDLGVPELVLFPNPTSNILQIKHSNVTITEISIYNRFGEAMYSVSHALPLLNLEKLPSGLYFVSITTETGNFVKQIIKE